MSTQGTDGGAHLYEVIRHVRPLHHWSAKVVAANLADHDMTMAMRAVLERLSDDGPATVPQVARSLWLPRQAVQRVVDAAAELGYVELRTNPHHRRSRLVSLTPAGARAFTEVHEQELASLRVLAAGLDPDDIAACVRVMAALTRHAHSQAQPETTTTGGPRPGPGNRTETT